VTLSIYDVNGRLVERLVEGAKPAGEHTITWEANRMASGVYFCRINAEGFTDVTKLFLIK
jgi:hypothetical protein